MCRDAGLSVLRRRIKKEDVRMPWRALDGLEMELPEVCIRPRPDLEMRDDARTFGLATRPPSSTCSQRGSLSSLRTLLIFPSGSRRANLKHCHGVQFHGAHRESAVRHERNILRPQPVAARMAFTDLTAQSLGSSKAFNWVWLVELLVCGILVLFFLFYFNRLFATLVSYAIRAYIWHTYRIYIDIQALQISLLGGRIFFKGFRYHGENETVLIQNGFVTWRYWMRSARQIDLARYAKTSEQLNGGGSLGSSKEKEPISEDLDEAESGRLRKVDNAEARLAINVTGLEWFLYNRTPAYDAIVTETISLQQRRAQASEEGNRAHTSGTDIGNGQAPSGLRHKSKESSGKHVSSSSAAYSSLKGDDEKGASGANGDLAPGEALESVETESKIPTSHRKLPPPTQAPPPFILRFFPLYIEVAKGAILVGNETTKGLIVTTFDRAHGHVDASSSGPLDLYRQIFDFEAEHPVVQLKPNPDFRQTQTTAAEKIITSPDFLEARPKWWKVNFHLRRRKRKAWNSLRNTLPQFRRSVNSLHSTGRKEKQTLHGSNWQDSQQVEGQWLGLGRYVNDDAGGDHEAWAHIDYARFSTVLDCPSIQLIFYWDVPGKVREGLALLRDPDLPADINGSDPPAYGMDLLVKGGSVDYGPWTDRLRIELQNAFFPTPYMSVVPAVPLKPGADRQSTRMIVRVEITEQITLRVPTRESSKDWQWRGRANALRVAANIKKQRDKKHFRFKRGVKRTLGPDVRPFGWLSFSVEADSTVRYEMDLVPSAYGYKNNMELDLKSTKATSSVNHAMLWRCDAQKVSADLSNPLGWNSLHKWTFGIQNDALELFLLRDHMFLLIDLIGDFTSGPGADYMAFVPYHYDINLDFTDLKLYLNTNDSNIIDNPCDSDDNSFLILGLAQLHGNVGIPLHYYRPTQSSILFKGDGKGVTMDLTTPVWNTLHTFMNNKRVATLKHLELDGSYNQYSEVSPELTDSLILDINGMAPRVFLHGFLIRYFMKMRDNYFAEDMHFRTMEEYQDALNNGNTLGTANEHAPSKNENDLDVILTIKAQQSSALLPANIYCRKENVRFDILLVEADLRFTNYYMDLEVSTSPIEGCLETISSEDIETHDMVTSTQVFIDGVNAFGHRLFGAPPTEPAYVCNWDVDVGKILGECSSTFIRCLVFAIRSLAFTIDEEENALPPINAAVVHDITFLRAHIDGVRLWLLTDSAAMLVELDETDVNLNDWAGPNFSKNVHATVPRLFVSAVDRQSASRAHDHVNHHATQQVKTLACFQTSINIQALDRNANFARDRALQQHHVRFHDQRTHRVEWLLHHQSQGRMSSRQGDWARHPPAMQLPIIPEPILHRHGNVVPSGQRHLSMAGLRRPSSFLSSSSSGNGSVIARHPQDQEARSRRSRVAARGLSERKESTSGPARGLRSAPCQFSTTGTAVFSSPWSAPHFSLQNVQPDTTEMPQFPDNLQASSRKGQRLEETVIAGETIYGAQMGVFCTLSKGLVGFCTPAFFAAISDLIKDLEPKHPVDLLDTVQVAAMVQVLQTMGLQSEHGSVVDLAIDVPFVHIKMINEEPLQEKLASPHEDQYDVILSQIRFNARVRSVAPIVDDYLPVSEGPLLFQSSVQQISVAVSERMSEGTHEDRASGEATLTDLSFWLGTKDKTRTKLRVRGIEVATFSKRMDYLASLIQRTEAMVEQMVENFEDLGSSKNIQHLVYHLTTTETHVADPLFLSRPAYVLRTAEKHLRLSDSWKIMSRLRYLYETTPEHIKAHIIQHATGQHFELPDDAERHVLSSFDRWRSWDNDRVESTPIMDVVYGPSAMPSATARTSDDYQVEVSVNGTALILDPGPQQSEILLGDVNIGVSGSTVSRSPDYHVSRAAHTVQKIQVQAFMSRFAVNLNWQVAELIGKTLEKFSDSTSPPSTLLTDDLAKHAKLYEAKHSTELFIVFGADEASIKADTINTSIRLNAERLQGSVAHLETDEDGEETTILLSSTTAAAKLSSRRKPLMGWRIAFPNIYTSIGPTPSVQTKTLRIAGTCKEIRFNMKEDIIGMLEVVDQILDHEVVFVQRVLETLREQPARKKERRDAVLEKVEAHVALFLDDYRLKFKLLPNLYYTIAGKVARTSVIPAGYDQHIVNLDLKSHSHTFQNDRTQHTDEMPRFDMPPISGVVSLLAAKARTTVDVRTIVEQIVLEAAAVRAFIDAMNQPGIAKLIVDAKSRIENISDKAGKLPGSDKLKRDPHGEIEKAVGVGGILQYNAKTTLAGISIHCSAPSLQDHDYRADLDFGLGFTTAHVHNHTDDDDIVHEKPQFAVNVQQIELGLRRQSREEDTNFGNIAFAIQATGVTEIDEDGNKVQVYHASSDGLRIDMYPDTASLAIDIAAFLQDRIKSFTLNDEARQFRPLRRLTIAGLDQRPSLAPVQEDEASEPASSIALFNSVYALELNAIQARWILHDRKLMSPSRDLEDLVFSIAKIDLRTKREGSARLAITDLQLQMVPKSMDPIQRTSNSALLPEMVFNVQYLSTKQDRRYAFQAAGKALDLRLASDFILPASELQNSVAKAAMELREANRYWVSGPVSTPKQTSNLLGSKRLASLLVDADFAGAIVNIKARKEEGHKSSAFGMLKGGKRQAGRYGQVVPDDASSEATLQAPGIAFKVEYRDNGTNDPILSAEIKVAASNNTLYPSVVPLILEITSSVKEMVGDKEKQPAKTVMPDAKKSQSTSFLPETVGTGDPTAILGRTKLNLGLWIQEQEFSLSCQPIARVAATARFDDIFMNINTVQAPDQERFFALVTTFNKLSASVQHVYSRESTASFDVDSIVVSMMNSKHVGSTTGGISAILNVSPMRSDVNAKQLQDFLLFREIWYPHELRQVPSTPPPPVSTNETQANVLARYQQVATTGTFAWNAVVSVQELKVQLDLGQGLGKSVFTIAKLWVSSNKDSDSEQNLCLGFEKIGVESTGRMSGFVELQDFRVRTSIRFPHDALSTKGAPLVQGSIGFDHLRVKAAFDYQPFAVADISLFQFLIYNVHSKDDEERDRLVGILNGDKVQVFITPTSVAQSLGLYQAVERLIQEKEAAYQAQLRELDRFLRRKSVFPSSTFTNTTVNTDDENVQSDASRGVFNLHTDVIVTLKAINIGIFPGTFFDNQIFKVEATEAQARFAVSTRSGKTHSGLGLTLGELRVALSSITRTNTQALGDVSISDVIQRSTLSKGGTILKVPKVVAVMQTWQTASSNVIEYIFKSTFEGKVDVGWNYSRISFIRGMWSAHSRALAHRLGKPLSQSALQIKAEPQPDAEPGQEKITAVVNVPQSRFEYVALEPAIIDTPQLRDMGEATPPLEWIGLHRDRLPNVTHQIIIVTLLEIAREVEDAYSRILGSS